MVATDYPKISSFPLLFIYRLGGGKNEEDITGQSCKPYFHHGNWVTAALSSWISLKAVWNLHLPGDVIPSSSVRLLLISQALASRWQPLLLNHHFSVYSPTLHLWSQCSLRIGYSQAAGDCGGHSTTTIWGSILCFRVTSWHVVLQSWCGVVAPECKSSNRGSTHFLLSSLSIAYIASGFGSSGNLYFSVGKERSVGVRTASEQAMGCWTKDHFFFGGFPNCEW